MAPVHGLCVDIPEQKVQSGILRFGTSAPFI